MIFFAFALQATAPSFSRPFQVFGAGSQSCATAFSPSHEYASSAWIVGFVSGVNGARGGMVGATTDGNGIVAEVRLACERTPSNLLVQTTLETYNRLAARR